ncbi:MAG: alanine dehydrogenase, partial [Spirochaetota bacterium]
MVVGIPKEIKVHEYRVGAKPNDVAAYVRAGHQVLVQAGAGDGAGFSDAEYRAAGAQIAASAAEVWKQSGMIVKVKEPQEDEFPYFREGLVVYAYLHLASGPELTDALLQNKVTGVAYETITDSYGELPCQRPMSAIAGRLALIEGSSYLLRHRGG